MYKNKYILLAQCGHFWKVRTFRLYLTTSKAFFRAKTLRLGSKLGLGWGLGSVGMVRVRAWVIHCIYKGKSSQRYKCVWVQSTLVDVFSDAAIKIPVLVRLN